MASSGVSLAVEQRVVMKFLVAEGTKASEIHARLKAQFGEDTLSRRSVFKWCTRFKDGRESVVDNSGHGGSDPTVVTPTNIHRVETLVLADRRVSVRQLVQETGISYGSVETILHEHLYLSKLSARWVPKHLNAFNKQTQVNICRELLARFAAEGQSMLNRIVTCNETCVHHHTPESKRASMEWRHNGSPPPKKFKQVLSAGKLLASLL